MNQKKKKEKKPKTPKPKPEPLKQGKVPVPESLLKKRRAVANRLERESKKRVAMKKQRITKRKVAFKRAEQYVKEYRSQERELINSRRLAKKSGTFFVEPQPRLAFVIRIRGINGLAPKPKKILQLLRLRQINNGVFVRLNGATSEMLRLVEPYVTFGVPNLKTVRELIYKRGFARSQRQRRPISDNAIVEKHLGKFGIVCIEDLIHEIYTVGPNFKAASHFLWTFKLNPPRGGWVQINRHYIDGGDFGDRSVSINKLVRRMN